MLGEVTYAEPMVGQAIAEYVIPVQVNTQDDANASIVQRFRQVWTPDLRLLDADGFEYHRWNGYLPPAEFIPQLLVGCAEVLLRQHSEADAEALYEQVTRRFPTSHSAAQAWYFAAVAQYKESGDGSDLLKGWRQLRLRHPASIWRVKQLFSEQA
jgi:hypothetical protein